MTADMASLRAICVQEIWWLSMTSLQSCWMREEQQMSSTWIKYLALSWTTPLSLRHGLDGPLSG